MSLSSPAGAVRRSPAVALLAVAAGTGAGAVAVASVLLPHTLAIAAGVVCICAWAAVGDPRPALLAVVAFELPLQLDLNLGYRTDVGIYGAFGGIDVSLTTFAVMGLLLAEVVRWATGERRRADGRPLVAAYAAYVVLAALSVLWARDRFLALTWVLFLVENLLLLCVVPRVLASRRDVLRFIAFLLAALGAEAALIIYQATSGAASIMGLRLTGFGASAAGPGRAGGTVGSPNAAAAYLSILLPLALAVVLGTAPRRLRLLAGAAFGLGVTALLVGTVSRGGVLALLVGCSVLIVLALRRRWLSEVAILAVGLAVVTLLVAAGGGLLSRLQSTAGAAAAQDRIPLISLAAAMIRDHPLLGVGANNFVPELPGYLTARYDFAWIYVVHNDYLLVWAELGLVGLIAYAVFLFRVVQSAVRATTRASDPIMGLIAAACLGGIVGRLVHMNFDVFNGPPQVPSLITVAALVVAVGGLADARGHADPPRRRTSCVA
jgi:putative inorganic carbon (HCO3(-)) transporter